MAMIGRWILISIYSSCYNDASSACSLEGRGQATRVPTLLIDMPHPAGHHKCRISSCFIVSYCITSYCTIELEVVTSIMSYYVMPCSSLTIELCTACDSSLCYPAHPNFILIRTLVTYSAAPVHTIRCAVTQLTAAIIEVADL